MSDLVRLAAVALLLLGVTLQGASVVAEQDDDAVAAGIARLLSGQQPELRGFYQARAGRPAWPDDQAVAALAAAIGTLDGDGLRPADYHPTALLPAYRLAQAAAEPLARARFDLQLSELLLTVLHHVQRGKLDPAA
ncbi:MAG TPA: murein L,D-transpeptidase, partial [Pseudomonadales bacterium]|nr:murein L,D-transpeptidase [Pseudomonadales bacterium]